jgi:hypothetical protein
VSSILGSFVSPYRYIGWESRLCSGRYRVYDRVVARRGERIVPQRYPCGAVCGRGRSRRCGGGSCAGGRETRICHSGSGRSCCRRGRRVCPVKAAMASVQPVRIIRVFRPVPFPRTFLQLSVPPIHPTCNRAVGENQNAPCQGRSSGPRRYRRTYAWWRCLSTIILWLVGRGGGCFEVAQAGTSDL